MEKVLNWFKNEFWTGYSLLEKCFMIGMILLQIVVFAIVPDSVIGIISGISGVISVVLCAKGKISFYYIGFVQTISYLVLAWQNMFYGEVIENLFYLVTMIMGIFMWKKHMITNEDGTKQVEAKAFTVLQWVGAVIVSIIGTLIMGFILNLVGSAQPYTDAATNVFAIFGQILMIKRFKEQWIWWLAIDVFCIKMWAVAGNWSMVAMYIAWTANCIYGWYTWTKLNKKAGTCGSSCSCRKTTSGN